MKIIKKGIDPKKNIWKGDCTNCKSIIEAMRHELNATQWSDQDHSEFGRAPCPVCGYGMIFYPKEGE